MKDERTSYYVGLDVATWCGIAIFIPSANKATVQDFKGTPLEQAEHIKNYISTDCTVVFELEMYFRNAKTIRSLIERQGYIKHALLWQSCRVTEVPPKSARRFLNTKSKAETHHKFIDNFWGEPLTNNHTDALAVAMYQAYQDGWRFNPDDVIIRSVK